MSQDTRSEPEGPDYDAEIDADELLVDLAAAAADYGKDFEEKRQWWRESWHHVNRFDEAKYWMLEAAGGRRAYSNTIAELQPGGRFRAGDGSVRVRELLRWLSSRSEETNEARQGDYTNTRQSSEAHSAYCSIISTLRDDYGIGWPRFDDLGGELECDLP